MGIPVKHQTRRVIIGILTWDHVVAEKNVTKDITEKESTAPPKINGRPGSSKGHCCIPLKNHSQRKKNAIEKVRGTNPPTRNMYLVNL